MTNETTAPDATTEVAAPVDADVMRRARVDWGTAYRWYCPVCHHRIGVRVGDGAITDHLDPIKAQRYPAGAAVGLCAGSGRKHRQWRPA